MSPRSIRLLATLRRAVLGAAAFACVTTSTPASAASTRAFVVCTDYVSASGALDVANLNTHAMALDVEPISSDPRVRCYAGRVYVVNRFGADNIQVIDPATNATIRQFSVGNGSNPYDIAFASPTKAYVTRYARSSLLIVNPQTGDSLGSIALGAFADGDGLPEMDRMIVANGQLFVSLQRLTNFMSTVPGRVVVIDMTTDTVIDTDPELPGVQAIDLPAGNPVTTFSYDVAGTRLLIGCVGSYGVMDGGIAAIDPLGLSSLGLVIDETALGGDVLDVVWWKAEKSFAIVADPGFNTGLIKWSAQTGTALGTLFNPGGFSLADVAVNDRDELYVCDNAFTAPGLFVFSAVTDGLLAGPLPTTLPPVEVAFDQVPDPASVPVARVAGLELSAPWPQPARGGVTLALELVRASEVRVEVIDASGRRVRSLPETAMAAGAHTISWDGRDAAGRAATTGIYWLRVSIGDAEAASRRVVVSR